MMAFIYAGYKYSDGSAYTRSSIAAALAVATSGDTVYVECYDANKSFNHVIAYLTIPAGVTLAPSPNVPEGIRVTIGTTTYGFIILNGATVRGFVMQTAFQLFDDAPGHTSGVVDSCVLVGTTLYWPSRTNTSLLFVNCLIRGLSAVTNLDSGRTAAFDHCTFIHPSMTVLTGEYSRLRNCLILGPLNAPGTPMSGTDFNASTGASFGTNFKAVTGDGHRTHGGLDDMRLNVGSELSSGCPDIGVATDIDGIPHGASHPYGCSVGSAKMDRNNWLSAISGNYVPPAVADVRPVAFGVSQTGTLANLDGTEAAYTALEATRNTDPGEAYVRQDVTYKILGVDKTGRDVLPAEAVVAPGTGYGTDGEEFEGAMDLSNVPDAPVITALKAEATQVTLSITAGAETDTVYGRYRAVNGNGDWSAITEALTRTGSGDLVFDTLEATVRYEFIVHAQAAGLNGDWSKPCFAEAMTVGSGLPVFFDQGMLSAMSAMLTSLNDLAEAQLPKVGELHQIAGLDAAAPMTVTPTERTAGDIALALSGDGVSETTVTRTA